MGSRSALPSCSWAWWRSVVPSESGEASLCSLSVLHDQPDRRAGDGGLTPETYRAKWGLPSNYPMVAPGYSERRSAIAVSLQLRNGYHPGPWKAGASRA